jgi:hypothetical protein
MANKFIGEVAAPEFGDGFTIRLDVQGQAELETEFGDPSPDKVGVFALRVRYGLAALQSKQLLAFLKVALRKDGVRLETLPEIPAPIAPIATKCLDAFALFQYGKTNEQWIADNAAEVEKAAKPNPTKGTKA